MKKEKSEKPQGVQKIDNYLLRYIETDYFQDEVKTLRKAIGIPKQGFKLTRKARKMIFHEKNQVPWVLNLFNPPELANKKEPSKNRKNFANIFGATKLLEQKLPIHTELTDLKIRFYIIYNYLLKDKELPKYLENFPIKSLCSLEDDRVLREELEPLEDSLLNSILVSSLRTKQEIYPFSIKIHPQATQRDITDYIKKNWKHINALKEKYSNGPQINKVKTTNAKIKERNLFVYKNRNLPLKELRRKIGIKFGFEGVLDDGHIAKIISLEKKKRKEL